MAITPGIPRNKDIVMINQSLSSSKYSDTSSIGFILASLLQFIFGLIFCNIFPFNHPAMAIVSGWGFILILIGIIDWKRHETYSAMVFWALGGYWWAEFNKIFLPLSQIGNLDSNGEAAFFYLWFCLLTLVLTLGSINYSFVLTGGLFFNFLAQVIIASAYWNSTDKETDNKNIFIAGGSFYCIGACVLFYWGIAKMINNAMERDILPIFSSS